MLCWSFGKADLKLKSSLPPFETADFLAAKSYHSVAGKGIFITYAYMTDILLFAEACRMLSYYTISVVYNTKPNRQSTFNTEKFIVFANVSTNYPITIKGR